MSLPADELSQRPVRTTGRTAQPSRPPSGSLVTASRSRYAPLLRTAITMSAPRQVRLVNDPTRIGSLTGRDQTRRNRRLLQIQFPDGLRWVPEAQVEDNPIRLSPLDMLEARKLGRPIDLRRTLTHVKLSGRLADTIYSMEATNTDFYAYQFKPVIKLLESPSNGILIADEVGLGKTIEAGLIWTELRARFDMHRLLVLCPAPLREKWQMELSTKIGVNARICDVRDTLALLRNEDARTRDFAIIASLHGLRPPRGWEEENNNKSAAQLARFLRSMQDDERLLDLLIVDEAHHLRNPKTQTNQLGQLCREVADYTVFLTATPIHNGNRDLLSLLRILDPDSFSSQDAFARVLEANAPLVKARDLLLGPSPDSRTLQDLLKVAHSHPLLYRSKQLSMIRQSDLVTERLSKRTVRTRLAYRLETVNLLAHVITRTRKRDVKEWSIVRDPTAEYVKLQPVERAFYTLVTEVVLKYALQSAMSERFLLAQPQRQMTSSMAASLRSWQGRLLELEESEQAGHTEQDDRQRKSLGPVVAEIVQESRNYVDLRDLVQVDAKYQRLRTILRRFLQEYPNEKIVVFSTFRATLSYLHERLGSDGISCLQLKGGQRESKAETLRRFRDPHGPHVLLSSEVGGEGVDLQFSRLVVNYDLPWNPMRLEQRIGRLDRLGQTADKVIIWNLLCENTIDARIYRRLYDKLDLCRQALGDFDAILGEEMRRLQIELLSGHLTVEQQERRIDQTAQALENTRHEEETLERDAASLVAYGDYLLNHVQAARDLHRWIDGDDIRRYVVDHLRLHYPGCDIEAAGSELTAFDICLSARAKLDLAEFVGRNRIVRPTRLTAPSARPVRCRFENRVVGPTNARDEIISQFHPLVRMISHRIAAGDEQLTPAVALRLEREDVADNVDTGRYILAAVVWSFRGLQSVEKLAYAAARLDASGEVLGSETAERIAMAAVATGKDWVEARNVADLERAYRVANELLFGKLDEEYEEFKQELNARNEDRANVQLRNLEQRTERQAETLKEIAVRHQALGRTSLAKATTGRIAALQDRVARQRMKVERDRYVRSESRETAIAIIEIG